MSNDKYPGFDRPDIFNRRQDKLDMVARIPAVPFCQHDWDEAQTFDESGNERVCKACGEVARTEITEFDKLSGCMDGEQFLKVKYGPGTPPPLQSFLLPTL